MTSPENANSGTQSAGVITKHSVTIRGHRTSFSLEQLFYDELCRLARMRGWPLARMVAVIDAERSPGQNLSSAIRVHVLAARITDANGRDLENE